MELLDYLRVLRRRWVLIVMSVVVALTAAVATMDLPSDAEDDGAPVRRAFTASHTLAVDNPSRLTTLGTLVGSDEVARRAAGRLGLPADPNGAAPMRLASVATDAELGVITLTASDADPGRAVEIAEAYATEAIAYVDERLDAHLQAEADSVAAALIDQQDVVRELETRLGTMADGSLDARLAQTDLDAAIGAYTGLQNRLVQLRSQMASSALYTLDPGIAVPQTLSGDEDGATLGPTMGWRARLFYAFGVGLLLGVGLAIVVERLDPRIHTRSAAEEAFGVPVVAEIPRIGRLFPRRSTRDTALQPTLAGSYGRLRVALLHMPRWILDSRSTRSSAPPAAGGAVALGLANGSGVVIVTSAVREEGRTSATINLAASLAAAGKRVAIIDCDHQKPQLADQLGQRMAMRPVGARESDEWALLDTRIPGVQVAAAPRKMDAGERAAAAQQVIQAAAEHVDLVLVDTGPLLSTIDAASLVPRSDAVVLVARAGRVTQDEAAEVRDLLANLHAPVTGVALIAVRSGGGHGRRRPRDPVRGLVADPASGPGRWELRSIPAGRGSSSAEEGSVAAGADGRDSG